MKAASQSAANAIAAGKSVSHVTCLCRLTITGDIEGNGSAAILQTVEVMRAAAIDMAEALRRDGYSVAIDIDQMVAYESVD